MISQGKRRPLSTWARTEDRKQLGWKDKLPALPVSSLLAADGSVPRGRTRPQRSDVAGKEQRHPWKSAVGSPPEPLLTSPTGQPDAFCRPLRPVARFRAEGVRGSNLYAQIYESRCWLNELPQTNEPTDSLYLTFMWLSQEPA